MESIWEQTSHRVGFSSLDENLKTDVLIIGGGLAGLLCAYMLKQAGVDCVLIEAKELCGGITKATTAKLTSQHGLIYDTLIKRFGTERAKLYLQANENALSIYREMCDSIDCDYEEKRAGVYSLTDREKLEREVTALFRLGCDALYEDELPIPLDIAGAVVFERQAQFHPLKFALAIAENLKIYERTTALELIGTTAVTERGRIDAKKLIVATHFPFINKHGSYFVKMFQERSYVVALKNAQDVNGMYVDEARFGLSFRNYGDVLLLGGGGHRTGKKGGCWRELQDFTEKHYPGAYETARWATQDCMSLDGVPYIGAYSAGTKDMFVASGFNKWGMTSSMVAANILCDLVLEKENPFASVFSPSRTMLRPQLAVNACEAVLNLLTPTAKRCPHLGCALKWNAAEHTWDCPCHGSRFAQNGALLDNPATGGLKK